MKIAITLAAVAGLLVPASPALAAPAAGLGRTGTSALAAPAAGLGRTDISALAAPAAGLGRTDTPAPAAAPALVAQWDFNAGPVGGKVADISGRGPALAVRAADQGAVRFEGPSGGRYVAFPAACADGATACPRGLLEAADDADLNPGTRLFRWSAKVQLTPAQLHGSANVMQKGVAGTGSQWKLQIGATQGRAQCVVAGTGSPAVFIARSAGTVADGAWHKILCQRAGSTLAVYVDGAQRGQTAIPAGLSIGNAMPLRLGGPNFNIRSDMYHGNLDDVYAELG